MKRRYSADLVDGVEVPPLVVTEPGNLPRGHRGSIHVEAVTARLVGTHQGSLWLHDGATVELTGSHQGSLHVDDDCRVVITGRQQGSIHIDHGGEVIVERGGTHQGSIHNLGRYEVRGTRGGSLEGPGEYVETPGCRVVQPKIR